MNLNQKTIQPARALGGLSLFVLAGVLWGGPDRLGAQATLVSFTNSAPITINDSYSDSSPFPSAIQIPIVGALQSVTVTLNGLTDPSTSGIELLLVGPTGVGVNLMCFAGNGAVTNVVVTMADSGVPFPNGPITTGTYQPSGAAFPSGTSYPTYSPFYQQDTTNHLSGFAGTQLTGTWSLYGYDTEFLGSGAINGGWTLNLSVLAPPRLDTSFTNGISPVLTLYGNPGSQYIIQATTNLAPPVTWSPILTNTLAGAMQSFPLSATNQMQYFRAVQN